ncbi:MAG: DNA methyltransferase [Desulfobacterales bacterium]
MKIQDKNMLYYGDNLEVMRKRIPDESVDLCYIDPPFNSKRSYNQIYLNVGEDKAQAQAFIDTWSWDSLAVQGYQEIILNSGGRFTAQVIELVKGLRNVIKEGSLLAYLVSMTLRITEIHRVLKKTGSFYLHCDPTCSHYLKLILDAVFCPNGGDFLNEIIWQRYSRPKGSQFDAKKFGSATDTIFFYSKSSAYKFYLDKVKISIDDDEINKRYNLADEKGRYYSGPLLRSSSMGERPNLVYEYKGFTPGPEGWRMTKEKLVEIDTQGDMFWTSSGIPRRKVRPKENPGITLGNLWSDIEAIGSQAKERLGYPTQKPEALLERIIKAGSNEGDMVLDAYCGCGTTVAVAERLKRNWTGIDITYQSISLVLKRLEDSFGKKVLRKILLDGIPKDVESARALAEKKDDRLRKEFEKWALLTYTNNRAVVNDKKGADKGIDGTAWFLTSGTDTGKAVFQVKSGNVNRATIAALRGDMEREKAQLSVLITLNPPTKPMREEAVTAGVYHHPMMNRDYDRISIVTVEELIEDRKRFEMPTGIDVVKKAPKKSGEQQAKLV